MMSESFGDFVRRATDGVCDPYDYQRRLADEGLPELLHVPTGSGKTLAAVLPWLWRLMVRPDTRASTPRRLVYVLPLRTLVEQTIGEVGGWLDRLGYTDGVHLHVLMGGVDRDDTWQMRPYDPAILVGTQDMILSRALLRGYAERRSRWPVSFGLLHTDAQWVFDETQLLGPALGTSAQLQGLRDAIGTAAPTATMWMSATLAPEGLDTSDHDHEPTGHELTDADRSGGLAVRLAATRTVHRLDVPDDPKRYPATVADHLRERHVPGTQTIAVCNTVERATQVYTALRKTSPDPKLLLIHSRFRPAEREPLATLLRTVPPEGRIIVSTQVLEAGVDISSRTLFTEAAPWSSIVQRAGRCNRAGEHDEASLLWAPPPKNAAPPYEPDDLQAASATLDDLEGIPVTSTDLRRREPAQSRPVYATLRRRDLLQLFDTAPDLSGADVDVTPWIRDGDDTTVFMAWRDLPDGGPDPDASFPERRELCPAPIGDVRKIVSDDGRRLWAYDRVNARWRWASSADAVPGAVLLADAADGGYDTELGWSPKHKGPAPPPASDTDDRDDTFDTDDAPDAVGRDDLSYDYGRAVSLVEHLADVEREVETLLEEYGERLTGLSPEQLAAATLAGRFHDLGKAHPIFQQTLRTADGLDETTGLMAKSRRGGGRHARPYLRHELVSALMLLHPDSDLLDGTKEPDLVAYLVAAHHGKVRLAVRSVAGEAESQPRRVLGVQHGDATPTVELPGGMLLPELTLAPDTLTSLGSDVDGGESWLSRTLRLRDRPDLGPFRLAFLEALVRIADWRASASYRKEASR